MEKFNQIAKTNQDNIRRILSKTSTSNIETVENENSIEEILNKTKNSFETRSTDDLGRTYQYLIDSLSTDANICLICIDSIGKSDAIWNCSGCFSPLHLVCVQQWIKDGIYQNDSTNNWNCPKCRKEFGQNETPKRYYCFCQKEIDPQFDPWIIPHSCGQTCGKRLVPECGHICLLLCHPGPCPPCPKQVNVRCYCQQSGPTARRCGFKGWICGKKCSKLLSCQQHRCEQICHPAECPPCDRTSLQTCLCGKTKSMRNCNEAIFQCDKICGRIFDCGIHKCEKLCHRGVCGSCPRQGSRTCPCGKTKFENLSCSEDVSTCGDTCDRKLNCSLHRCALRCHFGDCESCRQVVTKRCRCGAKEKSIPCFQEFLCETKCTRMRSCGKHPCKRKCCDGNCPPCQNLCGKTLNCRNHKCLSECHRGQCYPCTNKIDVSCACGQTSINVPCGSEKQVRKPRCDKFCSKPSDCHHQERQPHLCHFNDCPNCQQICDLPLKTCSHSCPVVCHDSVLVKEETTNSSIATPWAQKEKDRLVRKTLPCPPCRIPTIVSCFGEHTSQTFPCAQAKGFCCGQKCQRVLKCENHLCHQPCHLVTASRNLSGPECVQCEEMCSKIRPNGCQHSCPLNCHPANCPPCKQRLRMRCHCNSQVIHIDCHKFTSANDEEKEKLKSCGKPCAKKLLCGHSCRWTCHSGSCSPLNECSEEISVRCSCRRIQQQIFCHQTNATKNFRLPCDEICGELKKERMAKASIVESETPPAPPIVESATPRKRTTKSAEPISTPKKVKPRRFIWTLNKVIVLFSIFSLLIIVGIVFMLKEIS